MRKINTEYDIGKALEAIEDELIASMIRNMKRHKVEEVKEDKQWSMWQAEQLKNLEKYRKENRKKFKKPFAKINEQMEELIRIARDEGEMDQEIEILDAIMKGFSSEQVSKESAAEFFKVNDRKLNALIQTITDDMEKAETAVLRKADDQYRKAIFNAQMYANTGAGTYEKAVDMALKDMLAAGLTCIEYKNGARHTLSDYADMAIRTACKRAYLRGEGQKRQEWGIHTVIVNKRGNPCPKCLPFVGKVLIDDVWSGGSRKDGKYPLMSYAIECGLYHPRCKDSHTTYFPGISTADDTWTKEELEAVGQENKEEAEKQYAERQAKKYDRLAKYSLDEENKKKYGIKVDEWKNIRFKTGGMTGKEYAQSKRPLANFRALPQEKVVDVLREDSKEWIEKLSEAEKHAIRKYTYNAGDKKPNRFFERLNAMLRGDAPENAKLQEYAEVISRGLKKNKLKYDVVAYRGMDIDPSSGIEENGLFKPKQFFSTSVVENRSFNTKYRIVIYVKKGASAAYIEKLSHFPKQRELLLDKECIYRVLSRKGNTIELEVV